MIDILISLLKPIGVTSIISRIDTLRHVKLNVSLHSEASDFATAFDQDVRGSVPFPPFNTSQGREILVDFFKAFFVNNPRSQLMDLKVSFSRMMIYDRAQAYRVMFPIEVSRMVGDDAPGPLDGGLKVDYPCQWIKG